MANSDSNDVSSATICAQGGLLAGSDGSRGKVLWQASVYDFHSLSDYAVAEHVYRRFGSPNCDDLAAAVAALEGAEAGIATSSGMGAIVAAVLSVCQSGDILITPTDPYGGTDDFFTSDLVRFGIQVVAVDLQDPSKLRLTLSHLHSISKTATKRKEGRKERDSKIVVFVETISNPLLKVANISALSSICKEHGCILIVDNTFATPLRGQPLKRGADMVLHSATKFLGGHSDAVSGVLVGSSYHINKASAMVARWGLICAPFEAMMTLRGIRTLQVRMEQCWASAEILSKRLKESQIPLRVMSAKNCSLISFELPNGLDGVERALKGFKMIKLSPSLGGTSTVVSHSATSSHKHLAVEKRSSLGITDGLLRLSVGLEHVDDVWSDLQLGLTACLAL